MNTSSTPSTTGFASFETAENPLPIRCGQQLAAATDHTSLEDWIRRQPSCTDAGLRHVVSSLVAACLELRQTTGRSHGTLHASRVVLPGSRTRRLTRTTIRLAAPRAGATADAEESERHDLRAIGEIIVQLVEGRMLDATGECAHPLRLGEAWRQLGEQTDYWFLLCNQLLDPDLCLASTNLTLLAAELPLRRQPTIMHVLAATSCGLALLSGALFFAQPEVGQTLDHNGLDAAAHHEATPRVSHEFAPALVPARPPAVSEVLARVSAPEETAAPDNLAPAPVNRLISIAIEAQPGSLAAVIDRAGVFTSLGVVDPAGVLSRSLALAEGDYEFTLEHRNFAMIHQAIAIRPGAPLALNPVQVPMPGALRVTSTPTGAEVRINGTLAGATPLALDGQPAQRELLVEVSLAGHVTATRALTLEPREIRAIDFGALVARNDEAARAIVSAEAPPKAAPRPRKPRAKIVSPASVNTVEAPVPYAGPRLQYAWTIPQLDLAMQWIGPGEFLMGSPASESGRKENEPYQSPVRVDTGFWIGRFEISQAQFEAVMGVNPSAFARSRPGAPVEQVSWEDAATFCQRLTELERQAGRLPSGYVYALPREVEWEYACRAGSETPWPGNPEQMAWFDRNARRQTHAPGEKIPVADPFGASDSGPTRFIPQWKPQQPNNWGLYDMLGNVAEWCHAAHDTAHAGAACTVRGGSWKSPVSDLRVARREPTTPETRRSDIGFRVVLSAQH